MKFITCYFDFVSPYAYLAIERLPEALTGLSHAVTYRPVLLGALLQHNGHTGPAGIAPKRAWTYRHAEWLGQSLGIELQMPAAHPFNPLPLLRLALANSRDGSINRCVTTNFMRHVWTGGGDALDPARLQALGNLQPAHSGSEHSGSDTASAAKAQLRANTDAAVALQVFGVPSFVVDDKVFWGLDALPMLRAYLSGDPWFASQRWGDLPAVPNGLTPS